MCLRVLLLWMRVCLGCLGTMFICWFSIHRHVYIYIFMRGLTPQVGVILTSYVFVYTH